MIVPARRSTPGEIVIRPVLHVQAPTAGRVPCLGIGHLLAPECASDFVHRAGVDARGACVESAHPILLMRRHPRNHDCRIRVISNVVGEYMRCSPRMRASKRRKGHNSPALSMVFQQRPDPASPRRSHCHVATCGSHRHINCLQI